MAAPRDITPLDLVSCAHCRARAKRLVLIHGNRFVCLETACLQWALREAGKQLGAAPAAVEAAMPDAIRRLREEQGS